VPAQKGTPGAGDNGQSRGRDPEKNEEQLKVAKKTTTDTTTTEAEFKPTGPTFGSRLTERESVSDEHESEETAEGAEETLEGASAEGASETTSETEVEETTTDDETEEVEESEGGEVETAAAEGTEVAAQAKPVDGKQAAVAEAQPTDKEVPLTALLSERKKFQGRVGQLEEENRKLKEQLGQGTTEVDPTAAVKNLETRFDDSITSMSVQTAKKNYTDYDEKYQAVAKVAESNPHVLDIIQGAPAEARGEALYQMGEEILYQAKYGRTRKEQHENIRKEILAEELPKARAQFEKEVKGKLQKQKKAPTNISTARAAGGSTDAEYRGKSFGQRLRQ
jgi:hypothetical protein